MKLQESAFQNAQEVAQEAADDAVTRAQELSNLPNLLGGCLGEAAETARKVKTDLVEGRKKLEPAKKNITSLIQDRVENLSQKATEAANKFKDTAGATFSNAGQRLAEEALSEGISEARQAGRQRIREQLGRTTSKAVFGAMDVILNRQESFFRGVMGILIHRELRELRKLEQKARQVNRKARTISRAVQIVRAIRDAVSGDEHGPPGRAHRILRGAHRNLRNALQTYKQSRKVPEINTTSAARSLKEASRVLSSNPVARNIMQGLRSINFRDAESIQRSTNRQITRRQRRAERARRTVQDAWTAIKELPGDVVEMADIYGRAVTWAKLAQTLPDTMEAVNSAAWVIKAGERLRYLTDETEALKEEVGELTGDENPERRARLAEDAQMLALGVEALKEIATDPNRRTEGWYEQSVGIFEDPFLQGGALSDLRSIEVKSKLIGEARSIVEKGAVAQQALDASQTVLYKVGSARGRAERAARQHDRANGATDLVRELLERGGIENPIDTLVRGELPAQVKTIVAAGSLGIPDEIPADVTGAASDVAENAVDEVGDAAEKTIREQVNRPCKTAEGFLPSDEEVMQIASIDKVREKQQALTGSIQAMKESDEQIKADVLKYSV